VKARNQLVGSPMALPHSKGSPYNQRSWEIGECTRVARMRSISVDGQGHYNPDRSEDLWGKAVRLE